MFNTIYCKTHNNFIDSFLPPSKDTLTIDCFSSHGLGEFTIPHIISGMVAKKKYPKLSNVELLILHLLWEFLETTSIVKKIFSSIPAINGADFEYTGDSLINSMTDNLAFYIGIILIEKKIIKSNNKKLVIAWLISMGIASLTSYVKNQDLKLEF